MGGALPSVRLRELRLAEDWEDERWGIGGGKVAKYLRTSIHRPILTILHGRPRLVITLLLYYNNLRGFCR